MPIKHFIHILESFKTAYHLRLISLILSLI